MTLPTIAMFWDGPPLGFVERLCLASFRDIGHPVVLFSYNGTQGQPDGIEEAPASDILPDPEQILTHKRTGSASIHADKFRYHLLKAHPGIVWADTDIYCLKPFETQNGYLFGRETDTVVCNAVMALPSDSPTLQSLIDFCEDEYAIPPWMLRRQRKEMQNRAESGDPMHVSEMPWGAWGPRALTHFLTVNDEFKHALAPHMLYPVPFENRRVYFRPAPKTWEFVQDDTIAIHFYGRRVRERLKNRFDGVPPEDSILAELGRKHDIAP